MSLVEGLGSEDNNKFKMENNKLFTNFMFNYELKVDHSIRIGIGYEDGSRKEKVYVVRIMNAHENPTNIWLSKTEIEFGTVVNTVIGTLIPSDEDAGETFTFSLVGGKGDEDNY